MLLSLRCDVSEGLRVSTPNVAGHMLTGAFSPLPTLLPASWQQFLTAGACLQGTTQLVALSALKKQKDQFCTQYKQGSGLNLAELV